MDKTFIFDYDDTLAWNQHDYSVALLRFTEWIIQKLSHRAPSVQTIINLEESIDNEAVKIMGFRMERFPTSFQETYKKICKTAGIKPNENDLQTAYSIGISAFDEEKWKKQGLAEGAPETLDYLAQQNDELILLTKGDRRVQEKKLEATNCKRWFNNNICIVDHKDSNTLLSIVDTGINRKYGMLEILLEVMFNLH